MMYAVHLGFSGFPMGNAPIQRIRMMFKALRIAGYVPIIVNKFSLNKEKGLRAVNRYDQLLFIEMSSIKHRPENPFARQVNKISGLISELFFLIKKRRHIEVAFLYTPSFLELIYYRVVSKMLKFRLVIQYVELRSAIPERNHALYRFNDELFDKYCYLYADGFIVISDFLREHLQTKKLNIPIFKLPVVCDFNEFASVPSAMNTPPYLMYCGTINYLESITFVLELYIKIRSESIRQYHLLLVISGDNKDHWQKLLKLIEDSGYNGEIKIVSNILYSSLIAYYKGAQVLILPLRDSLQDIARFPHKIGEYTASRRPILTTNLGEIRNYFDSSSAILSNEYDIDAYMYVLKQTFTEGNLDEIGINGHQVGYMSFHYENVVQDLTNFLKSF